MVNIQHDEDESSYPDAQPEDADKGGDLIPPENAKGYGEEAA